MWRSEETRLMSKIKIFELAFVNPRSVNGTVLWCQAISYRSDHPWSFFFALLEDYITTYAILFLKGNVITFRTKNKKQKKIIFIWLPRHLLSRSSNFLPSFFQSGASSENQEYGYLAKNHWKYVLKYNLSGNIYFYFVL